MSHSRPIEDIRTETRVPGRLLARPHCWDIMTIVEHLGKVAYSAYCDSRRWKSYDGKELPHWDEVKPEIKEGWMQSARAVRITLQGYIQDIQLLNAFETQTVDHPAE